MKRHHSYTVWLAFSTLVFLVAFSIGVLADEKHKSSQEPSKPAPPARSSSGSASHGGSSGRPSGGAGSGRPSGGATSGRPTGAASGRPSGGNSNKYGGRNNAGGNNGHPGSSNGRTTNGNNGHPGGNGGNGSSAGGSGSRSTNSTGGYGSGSGKTATSGPGRNDHDNRDAGRHEPGKDARDTHSTERGHEARHEAVRHESQVGDHHVFKDQRGQVREVRGHDSRGRDLAVHHDLHGGNRFETRGPGGRRVVGFGHGRGFTERRFVNRGGHVYVQRTYVYGGRRYAYAYRSYYYHGYAYYGYAPAFYYHPGFYGWAYNPWAAPVYYNWGWAGNPWYASYGYYYQPYPVYPSASLWLTDYLLAESLRAAYDARAEANANAMQQDANYSTNDNGGGGQVALSPEVKQMIADEVKRQLDAERNAAAQPAPAINQAAPAQNANNQPEETPAALDPNQRVFVVASNLDLVGDSGECSVTAGDVLVRSGDPNGTKVGVSVVSSKKGDCAVGTGSDLEISDLQEMHNQFREKMDSGLKTLAENQGKNGLPKAPDTGTTAGEVPAPQPDADAGDELQNQQKDAESAEQGVQKGSPGGK
ncbi:MAG TPA: hypothetical protein VGK24_15845 [Candidatus Angelobacter sp.]